MKSLRMSPSNGVEGEGGREGQGRERERLALFLMPSKARMTLELFQLSKTITSLLIKPDF